MNKVISVMIALSLSVTAAANDLRSYVQPKDSEKMSNMGLDLHTSPGGELYLMSTDTRYVVKGDFYIIDRFNGHRINSMSSLRKVKDRVDLSLIGINPRDLAATTLGAKNAKIGTTLFFNPLSENSQPLLKKIKGLEAKGQFVHIIPFPTQKNSMEEINNVICGFQDRPTETLEKLLSKRRDFRDCAIQESLMRSLLTASLLAQGEMRMAITSTGKLLLGKAATQFDEIVASESP